MRGQKIRVWDENSQTMIYEVGITPEGIPYTIPDYAETSDQFHYYPSCHKMESTGLKDRNGVEIYAEDMVSNPSKSFNGNGFRGKNLRMLVEWDQNECCYRLTVKTEGYFGYKKLTKSSAKDIEVFGNVYEMPEWDF